MVWSCAQAFHLVNPPGYLSTVLEALLASRTEGKEFAKIYKSFRSSECFAASLKPLQMIETSTFTKTQNNIGEWKRENKRTRMVVTYCPNRPLNISNYPFFEVACKSEKREVTTPRGINSPIINTFNICTNHMNRFNGFQQELIFWLSISSNGRKIHTQMFGHLWC